MATTASQDGAGIKSIRRRARLHASLTGRTAEQVLELALTQERAGQERARQAEQASPPGRRVATPIGGL